MKHFLHFTILIFAFYQYSLNAQNVGIGTPNPLSKLHIDGSLTLENNPGQNNPGEIRWYNNQFMGYDGSQWIPFGDNSNSPWTENGDSVYVLNKNIGIGTSSPETAFQVRNGTVKLGTDLPEGEDIIVFDENRTQAFRKFGGGNLELVDSWANRSIIRFYRNSDNVEIPNGSLFVDENVGIGTTTPKEKLEVMGNTRVSGSLFIGNEYNNKGVGSIQIKRDGADNGITFWTETSGIATKRIWIDDATETMQITHLGTPGNGLVLNNQGYIGIGEIDPEHKLHLSSGSAYFTFSSSASNGETIPTSVPSLDLFRGSNGRGSFLKLSNQDGFGGIGANDNFLVLYSADEERLRIDNSGNVGIGINSPSERLEVEGNAVVNGPELIIKDNNPRLTIEDFSSGADDSWSIRNQNGDLKFIEDLGGSYNQLLTIENNGEVGIGTPNPLSKLHIDGSLTLENNPGQNNPGEIRWYNNQFMGYDGSQWINLGASGTSPWTENGDSVYVLNKNVGIGRANPEQKLEVAGNIKVHNAVQYIGGGRSDYVLGNNHPFIYSSPHDFEGSTNMYGSLILQTRSTANRPIVFVTGSSPSEKMRVTGEGNVGIGTNAPGDLLHVSGSTGGHVGIRINNNDVSAGQSVLRFSKANAIKWGIGLSDNAGLSGDDFQILEGGQSGNPKVTVKSGGNVGIGITNPSRKLHIAGDILLEKYSGAEWLIGQWGSGNNLNISGPTSSALQLQRDVDDAIVTIGASANGNAQLNVSGSGIFSGNVGIGTANPDQLLELDGGGLQINSSYGIGFAGAVPANGNSTGDRARIYYDYNLFGTNGDGLVIEKNDGNGSDPDGGIAFANKGSDNAREIAMVIRGNGNVGIGTNSPAGLLHVADKFGTGGKNLVIGDDAYFSDLDIGNTVGVYGMQNSDIGSIKFGASGPRVTGENGTLWVCGKLSANELRVEPIPWCDYVFKPGYQLRPLSEVERFIKENHHLPEIPSEKEVAKKGVNIGVMQSKLLLKVEELTLYTIELEKKIKALESKLDETISQK